VVVLVVLRLLAPRLSLHHGVMDSETKWLGTAAAGCRTAVPHCTVETAVSASAIRRWAGGRACGHALCCTARST